MNGNRSILKDNQHAKQGSYFSICAVLEFVNIDLASLPLDLSKKSASRNIEALGASSIDFIQILTDIFFDSPPEKRTYIKVHIFLLWSFNFPLAEL